MKELIGARQRTGWWWRPASAKSWRRRSTPPHRLELRWLSRGGPVAAGAGGRRHVRDVVRADPGMRTRGALAAGVCRAEVDRRARCTAGRRGLRRRCRRLGAEIDRLDAGAGGRAARRASRRRSCFTTSASRTSHRGDTAVPAAACMAALSLRLDVALVGGAYTSSPILSRVAPVRYAWAVPARRPAVALMRASSAAVVTTEQRGEWLRSRSWLPRAAEWLFAPVYSENLPEQPHGEPAGGGRCPAAPRAVR